MKIVAPVPVYGRLPLLKYTIPRLRRQVGVDVEVVCVGGRQERAVCEAAGAHFVEHRNCPLGAKWQRGFDAAREFNPDAILYCGSGDWFCDEWCSRLLQHAAVLAMDVPAVGKRDYYYLNIGQTKLRGVYWPHYPEDSWRVDEAIGGGRIIFRETLARKGWRAFHKDWDHSMDYSLQLHVGLAHPIDDMSICAADISTCWWGNKHDFEKLTTLPHCEVLDKDTLGALVNRHFREIHSVFGKQLEIHGLSALPPGRQHRRCDCLSAPV